METEVYAPVSVEDGQMVFDFGGTCGTRLVYFVLVSLALSTVGWSLFLPSVRELLAASWALCGLATFFVAFWVFLFCLSLATVASRTRLTITPQLAAVRSSILGFGVKSRARTVEVAKVRLLERRVLASEQSNTPLLRDWSVLLLPGDVHAPAVCLISQSPADEVAKRIADIAARLLRVSVETATEDLHVRERSRHS